MKHFAFYFITLALFAMPNNLKAHCEIPCGIYGDSVRIALIEEHISTLEKSMVKIEELSQESPANYNQIVRWVMNKEEHAVKIQEIVSQYFLHQRIKPVSKEEKGYATYIKRLELLHQLQVYSMKAKQTTDLKYTEKLRVILAEFESSYFHKH